MPKEFEIKDATLLKFLSINMNALAFLSEETKDLLKPIFKKTVQRERQESGGLVQLWSELLTDAIRFLKLCDAREKAFLKPQTKDKLTLKVMGTRFTGQLDENGGVVPACHDRGIDHRLN
jgi:hypothetical protein